VTGELITDSSGDDAYSNPLPFYKWGDSIGSNITDDKDKLIGYGNYLREFEFERGALDSDAEAAISGLINNEIAQIDPEYRPTLDSGTVDTDANLLFEAFGQEAKDNYYNALENGAKREDFSAEVNEAKQHLVEHGSLSLASLRRKGADGSISYELIGDSNILDSKKAVASALSRGAIRHSDMWQVARGMKEIYSGVNSFKAIRDNQVRSEFSAASQAEDKELYNEVLKDAKDYFINNKEETDPSALITKARTLLAKGYSSSRDIGENVSRNRFQDSDIMDALEQVASFEAYQKGEVDFISDVNKLGENIKVTKNGAVIAHSELIFDRGKFDAALELRTDLNTNQKTSLRNYRKDFFTRQFPQYDELFRDSTVEKKWGTAKIDGKQKGLSNGQILERFIADPKNYSGAKNRLGAIGDSIADSFTGLAFVIPALFENQAAIDALVEQDEDRQNRRAVAEIFGDKFGLGMDVSTAIAPMVVDITATVLLSTGTLGTGGALYIAGKQGVNLTAKGAIKTVTGSVLKKRFGETTEQAAKRLTDAGIFTKGSNAADVQKAIDGFNRSLTRTVTKKKGKETIERQASSYLVSGVQTSALFVTAANRSAGATYATVYGNLEGTHEEKHDAAFGAAMMAGTATGLITAGFSSVGAGGFEDVFLRGITAKQHKSLLERMLRTKIAQSQYGNLMREYLSKRIKEVVPQRFTGLYRRFLQSGTQEFFEEGVDEFVNSFIVDAALNEDTPMIDRVTGAMYAGLVGGIIGQGAAGVRSIAEKQGAFSKGQLEMVRQDEEQQLIKFLKDNNSPLTAEVMERITLAQLRTPASKATDTEYETFIGQAIAATEEIARRKKAAEDTKIKITENTKDTSGKLGSTPAVSTKTTESIDGEPTTEAEAEVVLYTTNIANDFNAKEPLPYLSGKIDSPTSEQKKKVFEEVDLAKFKKALGSVERYIEFIKEHEKAHIKLGHNVNYPKDENDNPDLTNEIAIEYEKEANIEAAKALDIDWGSLQKRKDTADMPTAPEGADLDAQNEQLIEDMDNLDKQSIAENYGLELEEEAQQKANKLNISKAEAKTPTEKFDTEGEPILEDTYFPSGEELNDILSAVRDENGFDEVSEDDFDSVATEDDKYDKVEVYRMAIEDYGGGVMDLTEEEIQAMKIEINKLIAKYEKYDPETRNEVFAEIGGDVIIEAYNEIVKRRGQFIQNGYQEYDPTEDEEGLTEKIAYDQRARKNFERFEKEFAVEEERKVESKDDTKEPLRASDVYITYSYINYDNELSKRAVRLVDANSRIKELEEQIENFDASVRDDSVEILESQIRAIKESIDAHLETVPLKTKPVLKQVGYAKEVPEGQGDTFEVSSEGTSVGKTFSPKNATIKYKQAIELLRSLGIPISRKLGFLQKDGKANKGIATIEDLYQAAKGTGKGQKAESDKFRYYEVYKGLWKIYFDNNEEQLGVIGEASSGKILTDKFAQKPTRANNFGINVNSQARAIHDILVEKKLRDPYTLKYVGDTTPDNQQKSPEVVYKKGPAAVRAAAAKGEGINTLRQEGEQHFGNPFSDLPKAKTRDTIKTGTLDETLRFYKMWLRGVDFEVEVEGGENYKINEVKQERRKWVLDQINQGKLDGQKLLYHKAGGLNHAQILRDYVLEVRGFALEQETTEASKPLNINIRYTWGENDPETNTTESTDSVKLNDADAKIKELKEKLASDTEAYDVGSDFGTDRFIDRNYLEDSKARIASLEKAVAEVRGRGSDFSLEQETTAPSKPVDSTLRYKYTYTSVDGTKEITSDIQNIQIEEASKVLEQLRKDVAQIDHTLEFYGGFYNDNDLTREKIQKLGHIEGLQQAINEYDQAIFEPEIGQPITYSYTFFDPEVGFSERTTKTLSFPEAKARLEELDNIDAPTDIAVAQANEQEAQSLRPLVEIYENKILQRATTKDIETFSNVSAKRHVPKEQVKTRKATQFIGDGAAGSSTDNYRRMYEIRGRANTGNYKSSDVVFVASNGLRKDAIIPVEDGELDGKYKLIDGAMEAGATIIMDELSHITNKRYRNYLSKGEVALADYVENNGYVRVGKTGEFVPKTKQEKDVELSYSFIPDWSNGNVITRKVKYKDINKLLDTLDSKIEFNDELRKGDTEGVGYTLSVELEAVKAAKEQHELSLKLNDINDETTESQIRSLSPEKAFESLDDISQEDLLKLQNLLADLSLIGQLFGVDVRLVSDEQRKAAQESGQEIKPFSFVTSESGSFVQIEPSELGNLVDGLSNRNAKALTSSVMIEEIIHAATFADFTTEEISALYGEMPQSEVNRVIDNYYLTEADKQAARARLTSEDPDVVANEQRTLGKEALRMYAQRALKGFTTEQDRAFYLENPNIFAAILRYLKGVVNRITFALRRDSENPYMSMAVNRVVQAYNDMKAGYQVEPIPMFDPDNPLRVVKAFTGHTETSEADADIAPEVGTIIEVTESQTEGNTTTEVNTNRIFKHGNLTGMLTIPVMKTGKYRGAYKGIMSWMNALVGSPDPRLQRLHQQSVSLRNAVFNEIQNYKDRLDQLVAKLYPDGDAPVDLFRSITGDAEVLRLDPKTTDFLNKFFDTKLKRMTQVLAALNEQRVQEPDNKELQANIKRLTEDIKDLDSQKSTAFNRAYQNKRALLEQRREYAIEQLGGYDENGNPKSEIVRHLLALRGKTDEFSKKIGELFPNDPEIKKQLSATIDANLEVYLTRSYKLFSDAGFADQVMYDSKYTEVRNEAAAFFAEEYKTHRATQIILNKEPDAQGNLVTRIEDARKIAEEELVADRTKSPSDQPPLIHNMMASFLNSFSNKDNLFTKNRGLQLVEGEDLARRMGFAHILKERLLKRKDIPQQLRALMGEEGDATGYDAIMRTYMHVGIMASHQAYLKNVLDFGLKEKNGWIIEEDVLLNLPDDEKFEIVNGQQVNRWEQIFADGDARFDPWVNVTTGKKYYATRDLNEALKLLGNSTKVALNESEIVATQLNRMAFNLTGLSMATKTLGSIGFYLRNILGNVVYFGLSQGMIAPIRYTKNMGKELLRHRGIYSGERFKASQIKLDEYYAELDSLDIIGDEIRPKMLDEIFRGETTPNELMDEVYRKTKQIDELTDENTKESDLKKIGSPLNKLYTSLKELSAVVDTFYKISYYENELSVLNKAKERGEGKYATMTDYEIKREAADKVLRTAQSYSRSSPLVRGWTKSSVGVMFAPFIRFKGEIVRISINTIRLAVEEMKDQSPTIKRRGALRLSGFLGTTVGLSAVGPLIARMITDVDDEEEAALRRTLVEYLRGHTFIMYREDGELKTLDLTYVNPYAMLADPVLRSVEKGFRGESPASMAMSFIEGLIFNEYLDDQIFAGGLLSLKANRDPQTNKKIWEERDEAEDVFIKGASFLLKEALEPRTIKAGREVAKMIGTNPVEEIFERIAKEFYPAKPYTVDISNNMRRYLFDVRRETQNISLRKNKVLSDNPITDAEMKALVIDEIDHRVRLDKEVAHTLKNLASLGELSDQDVKKIVYGSQFGKRRYGFLLQGKTETPRETHKGLKKKLRDKYRLTENKEFLRRERLLDAYFKNLPRFYYHNRED